MESELPSLQQKLQMALLRIGQLEQGLQRHQAPPRRFEKDLQQLCAQEKLSQSHRHRRGVAATARGAQAVAPTLARLESQGRDRLTVTLPIPHDLSFQLPIPFHYLALSVTCPFLSLSATPNLPGNAP